MELSFSHSHNQRILRQRNMLAVAAAVAGRGQVMKYVLATSGLLGLIVCTSCAAWKWGGQLPDPPTPGGENPLYNLVFPDMLNGSLGARNIGNLLLHGRWEFLFEGNWLALLPYVNFVVIMLILVTVCSGPRARSQSNQNGAVSSS